jgi:hypothetical protein
MPIDESNSMPQPESPTGLSPAAEAKRRAARRKFLARSSAGAGAAIVTLHHERASAWGWNWDGGGKVLVSSDEACRSIGGKPSGTKEVTSFSKKVKRTVCEK